MKHRPEIDGLRTIAVLPVILFHAGIMPFTGGFVGVDVFFVISGFLITGLLVEEIERGDFSLARFYERRARRILPALYFVLACSMPFALWLMLPDELADFGGYVVAVIAFISNIRLWLSTDYFAPDAELNPLLHTWSLGVEEQFYMLFPLVLLLAWRKGGRRAIGLVIAATVLLSFAFACFGWPRWPAGAFYLLPTRAWELGIGAGLATWLAWRRPVLPHGLAEAGGIAGLGLIAVAIFSFDRATPFPTWPALLPTLGAALVLLCARPDTLAGRLLTLRVMTFIGLISYSAYLWHQPLLAFARIASPEPPAVGTMALLSALSLILAAFSWRFVEQPFRNRQRVAPWVILRVGLGASATLAAVALALPLLTPSPEDYPAPFRQFLVTLEERSDYVHAAYEDVRDLKFADPARPNLLIIGDSHSQDLLNMIRETGAFADYEIAARYIPARCQVYLGDPTAVRGDIAPADREGCARLWASRSGRDLAAEADVVLVIASWRPWAAARLPETLAAYHFGAKAKVFVIGRKGFGHVNLHQFLAMDPGNFPGVETEATPDHRASVEAIRAALPESTLIDLHALLCGPDWQCPVFTPDGALISHDGSHLTKAGAAYVGDLLFRDPRLAPYRVQRTVAR